VIAQAERGLGKSLLATHERNEERLPAEEMLLAYKGQGVGMGLALLVYALAEHKLRATLQERGESVPNQAGKPTQRPTMRRIFQMFEGIDLLVINAPEGV